MTPVKIGTIPQARVEKSAAQSIPSQIVNLIPLTWETPVYDTAGLYNTATPDRLTAPISGVYAIDGGVRWQTNPLGTRFAGLCVNGQGGCTAATDVAVSQYATNDDPGIGGTRLTQQSVSTQIKLLAGDIVQLVVVQNSGAALNVETPPASNLTMTWVGNG